MTRSKLGLNVSRAVAYLYSCTQYLHHISDRRIIAHMRCMRQEVSKSCSVCLREEFWKVLCTIDPAWLILWVVFGNLRRKSGELSTI